MTHGQTDDINISTPIIVERPEQITALQAFEAQLLRTDANSKYLHVSPAPREAGRVEWLRLQAVEEAAAKCVFDYLGDKEADYGALIALILMGATSE
jgi:hypothetical protein